MTNLQESIEKAIESILYGLTGKEKYIPKYEQYFKYNLALELRKYLNEKDHSINITMEYNEINFHMGDKHNDSNLYDKYSNISEIEPEREWVIDIVIEIDNKFYPIELKYSAYYNASKSESGGSNYSNARKGFGDDEEKIIDVMKKYKKIIDCGYCILIVTSNIKSYFDTIIPKEKWKDVEERYSYIIIEKNQTDIC
jgi:hypothetical protein